MSLWPEDYIEKVLEDVKKYDNTRKLVKTGLIERCAVRYCSPEKLHPNPDDEFSQDKIGPNFEIVGKYVGQIKFNRSQDIPIFEEPVIVQKMKPDGFMLLNGHHRWFAAVRMGVKKLHIQIVNLITESDLNQMINKTSNKKLVTFDFDEVLLAKDEENQAPIRDSLFAKKIKERLRLGAPEVIRIFKDKGYDLCVYTAGYLNEDDFNDFFSMYELEVDVVVNGVNEKRKGVSGDANKMQGMIRDKYEQIIHVDNESVIVTNCTNREYEIHDFEDVNAWSDSIKKVVSERV